MVSSSPSGEPVGTRKDRNALKVYHKREQEERNKCAQTKAELVTIPTNRRPQLKATGKDSGTNATAEHKTTRNAKNQGAMSSSKDGNNSPVAKRNGMDFEI